MSNKNFAISAKRYLYNKDRTLTYSFKIEMFCGFGEVKIFLIYLFFIYTAASSHKTNKFAILVNIHEIFFQLFLTIKPKSFRI